MRKITVEQFNVEAKAQGVPRQDVCWVCPSCGTLQSARDLIKAGAGKTLDDVDGFEGFSCIGRFTHGKEPPVKKDLGKQVGCNWSLGGLFRNHELEVETPDGKKHARFELATAEQAKAHAEKSDA